MYYGERRPAPRLQPFAAACWHFRVDPGAGAVEHAIPPDGCVSIAIHLARPEPIVVGPFTEPFLVTVRGGDRLFGIRLLPSIAPALVTVPIRSLRNARVPLVEAGAADLSARLRDRMSRVTDEADAVLAWDAILAPVLLAAPLPDPIVLAVAASMMRAPGAVVLARVAEAAGLSPRQLRRRFVEAVGLSPKEFARVRRVRASLTSAVQAADREWTDIALRHGFADQAHMVREVRRLAGLPPEALLARLLHIAHGDIVDR